ncbi:MAG TPA: hypothetical protein VF704_02915 [Allosphingosinicella sp.]|jgi:hypothetical protein
MNGEAIAAAALAGSAAPLGGGAGLDPGAVAGERLARVRAERRFDDAGGEARIFRVRRP